MNKVFSSARSEWSLALLAIGSTALAACGSNNATYRPAPRYGTTPATTTAPGGGSCGGARTAPPPRYGTTTTQPTYNPPPTYTQPPPPPPPRGGQMSCGKGKCG